MRVTGYLVARLNMTLSCQKMSLMDAACGSEK